MSKPYVLPLHPLIKGLAAGLANPGQPNLAEDLATSDLPEGIAPVVDDEALTRARNAELEKIETFSSPDRAEVVMFQGYLGPRQKDPKGTMWQLLYQDAKAVSWLLVPEGDVVLHNRAEDKKAPFGKRDVIWVKADAPVRQGTEAESQQARFLVGGFTSAGDLYGTLKDASTAPPGSGILCAPTPECCKHHTG